MSFFLIFACAAAAQTISNTPATFNIVVNAPEGRAIIDLKPTDLRVAVDGKEQAVTQITPVRNLRRRVAFVVDASSSVRDAQRTENSILSVGYDYLNQKHRPDKDLLSLYAFDSVVAVLQPETNSLPSLALSLKKIKMGGGTALFEGVGVAATKVGDAREAAGVLIVISDGDDNQSHINREEAIEIAQRGNVAIFTFNNTVSSSGFSQGPAVLRRLAEATGGLYCDEYKPEKIAKFFERLEVQITSTYRIELGGLILLPDGKRHKLSVKSINPAVKVAAPENLYAGKTKK